MKSTVILLTDEQTDRQTNKQTNKQEWLHNFLQLLLADVITANAWATGWLA